MIILKIIFWTSIIGILIPYFAFPALVLFLKRFANSKTSPKEQTSTIEIIFAAYNEEAVLSSKIASCLESNYASDKLSISIGSDNSTDKTNEILEYWSNKDSRVRYKVFESRTGKSEIINTLVKESKADFLLLTDANIIFNPLTIESLYNSFDDSVGIVGGHIVYNKTKKGIADQENVYLKIENSIKQAESDIWSCAMGVEGGCYMIRRELFPEIPKNFFMEDFFVSLSVLRKSFSVKYAPRALCREDVSTYSSEEYKRKLRISIGNHQNLNYFRKDILKRPFPFGILFISHKVLRWFTPFFLILSFLSAVILLPQNAIYALYSGFYMLFISLGLFGILFSQTQRMNWLKFPGHFFYMNLALLEGFFTYKKGIKNNAWEPTKRNQD